MGFPNFYLLRAAIEPIGFDLAKSIDKYGWQITLTLVVVYTLSIVIRQRSANTQARVNANIEQRERDDEFRKAQEEAFNQLQAKHEKLMDESRLQMMQERNDAQERVMALMDSQQKLTVQFVEAQAMTIRLQQELSKAKEAEAQAITKSQELEGIINKLQSDLTTMQNQLATANQRIDELVDRNKVLELQLAKISTGSMTKIIAPEAK